MKNSLMKDTKSDKIFYFCVKTILILFLFIVIYPLIYVISASFSSPESVTNGRMWLFPVDFTLQGYQTLFTYKAIGIGYMNSLYYMILGTIMSLVMTMLASYPLSRKDLFGKKPLQFIFLFTMLFSGGLIPGYLVVKDLNLLDTRWALLIPGMLSVYNVIVMRTYFQNSIPEEILESATIDGCNHYLVLIRMIIPLSGPILAVIGLFYAIGYWNAYFNALLFINNPNLYPLQLVLRDILIVSKIDMSAFKDIAQIRQKEMISQLLKYAAIVASTVPVLILYPFVQKYFVKGMMIGSVKG